MRRVSCGSLPRPQEECSHEYFALWKQFQALVEAALQQFVAAEGLESHAAFYAKVKSATDRLDFVGVYVEHMIKTIEFERFVVFMKDEWRRVLSAADEMAGGK